MIVVNHYHGMSGAILQRMVSGTMISLCQASCNVNPQAQWPIDLLYPEKRLLRGLPFELVPVLLLRE